MKTSTQTDKILPLLAKVKAELGPVTKSSDNPFFKSKYADLNQHIDVIEPVLEANGLILLQPVQVTDQGINVVETQIIHAASGQWVSSSMALVNTPDMQKLLAAVTYARRGSLNSFFGLASLDDDGETAVGRGKPAYNTSSKPQGASSAPKEKEAPKGAPSEFKRGMGKGNPAASNGATETKPQAKKDVLF